MSWRIWLSTWLLTLSTMYLFTTVSLGLLVIQTRHVLLRCVYFAFIGLKRGFSRAATPTDSVADEIAAADNLFRASRLEAVDELMLRLFERQAETFAAAGPTSQGAGPPDSTESPRDAAIVNLSVEPGSPERYITFAGLIESTSLVSQAVAWELFHSGSSGVASADGTKQTHTVALMMSNSVDFIPLWAGVARSAPLLTALHQLADDEATSARSIYHHTCTALINTNIASNEMLFHALQCCDTTILIADPFLAQMLVDGGKLRVPPSVRRVLLWKGSKSVAPSLVRMIQEFNGKGEAVDLFHDLIALAATKQQELDVDAIRQTDRTSANRYRLLEALCRLPPKKLVSRRRLADWRLMRALLRFQTTDPLLLIFTSGTTGLPKAAKFIHLRFRGAILMSSFLSARSAVQALLKDKSPAARERSCSLFTVYNCLPMYHSAGGVFCTSHFISFLQQQQHQADRDRSMWLRCLNRMLPQVPPVRTARIVVRQKFSASNFSSDLQQLRVTIVQYIGEILRYATLFEETVAERRRMVVESAHSDDGVPTWIVPFAFGNGLRADVWLRAKELLRLGQIVEFYASTEGNVGFVNLHNEPHAIGHLPVFPAPFQRLSPVYWPLFPMRVLKYDEDTEEPWRDSKSHRCRCVGPNEVGEAVGQVAIGFDPLGLRRFDGYCDSAATKKKLLAGVFANGDVYFRTGDLVRFDERGFVSFVDRVGDTFRWKGENVSTLEVSNAINRVIHGAYRIDDAVVYGVGVPGREGRAGMAKLKLMYTSTGTTGVTLHEERAFMQDVLFGELSDSKKPSALPLYAIPVFIRIDDEPGLAPRGDSRASSNSRSPKEGSSSNLRSQSRSSASSARSRSPTRSSAGDDAAMTATFKYKKIALVREAYQFYITRHGAWQSRAYVLAPKSIVEEVAGRPPKLTSNWGYVPLDATTYPEYLGVDFKNCRW